MKFLIVIVVPYGILYQFLSNVIVKITYLSVTILVKDRNFGKRSQFW